VPGITDRLIAGYLDDLVRAIRTVFSAAWEMHGRFHFWLGFLSCFVLFVLLLLFALLTATLLQRRSPPR
jgi:uncharacterized BrkB/YihY/UPF0761 family membrane protein